MMSGVRHESENENRGKLKLKPMIFHEQVLKQPQNASLLFFILRITTK